MPWYCQYCGYETIRSAPFGRKDCPGCKRYSHWKTERPPPEVIEFNRAYVLDREHATTLPDLELRDTPGQVSPSTASSKRQQSIMFLTQRNEARYLLEDCRAALCAAEAELAKLREERGPAVPALLPAEDFAVRGLPPVATPVGRLYEVQWLGLPAAVTVVEALEGLPVADQAKALEAAAALQHPHLLRAYGVAALSGCGTGLGLVHARLPAATLAQWLAAPDRPVCVEVVR
eukprot:EG_transcript_27380